MRKHRVIWPAAMAAGLALGVAGAQAAGPPAAPEGAMATLHWTQPFDEPISTPAAPFTQAKLGQAKLGQAKPDQVQLAQVKLDQTQIGAQAQPDAALDRAAGRGAENTTMALTEQSLSAINTGNTIRADSVSSGAISLQDNALSGFAGIGNILMNTGHNNNLESNMSVTVIVTP